MKGPDQDILDQMFKISKKLGYDTVFFNPPKDTAYPFVHLGATQLVPRSTKTRLVGAVHQTIDVWGLKADRNLVSKMAHDLMREAGKTLKTDDGYYLSLDYNSSSIEVYADNSTNNDLWRARMTLEWKLY